jgi:hypothetical protein
VEKRRARAERFGIPFVENPVVPDGKRAKRGKAATAAPAADVRLIVLFPCA